MLVERFVYDLTPAKEAEIKRMSDKSFPESVGVGMARMQGAQRAPSAE